MYNIKRYSQVRAKKLGVFLKPSTRKHKKIDVFDSKDNKHVASVGYLGMMDYPSYIATRGKKYAERRRKLYYQRHKNDGKTKGSNGWWAKKLLW